MTPLAHSGHRYVSGGGNDRFYQAPGTASSSQANPPAYPAQTSYYSSQYPTQREHRTRPHGSHSHPPDTPFIPAPSEVSHSYNNYPPRQISVPPQSPSIPHDIVYSGSQYPPPHTIVPSSRSSSQRPTRISTSGRPQTAPTGQSPTSASSPSGERFPCDRCGKTFSRSHDRKRHHETQHLPTPVIHRCRYCEKEFSRADSLKRHLDNGCDEMPT
ncbi:hypothetical protein BDZ94DRAFT_731824 [Collybia nuda]|uniref:C2H2-type domain-containing protein n=1 Tax=Collybia nuda TaxID=64659 RepID=A0A9P5Y577_9AGAR|nr:hypothetical protein BDZ94DRAFT_731824 [Collybia nuda]